MKVLFLDIDGVLNSRDSDAKCAVTGGDLLKPDTTLVIRLLGIIQATGCKIVMTSSWRADKTMVWPFPVYDITPRGDAFGKRGDEIAARLRGDRDERWSNQPGLQLDVDSFVILDDEPDAGYLHPDRFVQTDPAIGLSPADAERIIGLFT